MGKADLIRLSSCERRHALSKDQLNQGSISDETKKGDDDGAVGDAAAEGKASQDMDLEDDIQCL